MSDRTVRLIWLVNGAIVVATVVVFVSLASS